MTFEQDSTQIITLRLTAVREAQQRARIAFYVCTLAASIILSALWNEYLSWDRTFSTQQIEPKNWAEKQLLMETIKTWLENQMVGVAVLGLRFSVSDVAVLGSISLLILSTYTCFCFRAVHREIGSLLSDSANQSPPTRWLIFFGVGSFSLFSVGLGTSSSEPRSVRMLDRAFTLCLFLPVIALATTVLSDVYFAVVFISPFRENVGPAWNILSNTLKLQLVMTDAFAVLIGFFVFIYCKQTTVFHRETDELVCQFYETLRRGPTQVEKE